MKLHKIGKYDKILLLKFVFAGDKLWLIKEIGNMN